MLESNSNIEEHLDKYFSRLGWQVIDASVFPISIFDRNELAWFIHRIWYLAEFQINARANLHADFP